MEVQKEGRYWVIKGQHGPLPAALRGVFTHKDFAERALSTFQKGVQAKVISPAEKEKKRQARAASFLS